MLPLALTLGEPAGIGPDITLLAWGRRAELKLPPFYMIADSRHLALRARSLGLDIPIVETTPADAAAAFPRALPVVALNIAVTAAPGAPDAASGPAAIASIERAVADVLAGRAGAVVTNPVAKNVLYSSGFAEPGHTEFLARLAQQATGKPARAVMMLAAVGVFMSCSSQGATVPTVANRTDASVATSVPSSGSLAPPGAPGAANPTTSPTSFAFPATEPRADPSRLRSFLLSSDDLPPGFVVVPGTETSAASISIRPCNHPVAAESETAQVRVALDRAGGSERVVQQVAGFKDTATAATLVAQVRAARDTCHRFDGSLNGQPVTMTVTPINPPTVGEEVAGLQLAGSGRYVDVVVLRSGPIDVVVIVTAVGHRLADATLQATVVAAGTKLAVGTGG